MANLELVVRRAPYCPNCNCLLDDDVNPDDPNDAYWCDNCDEDHWAPPFVLGFTMILVNPELDDDEYDPDGMEWDWVPGSRTVLIEYT